MHPWPPRPPRPPPSPPRPSRPIVASSRRRLFLPSAWTSARRTPRTRPGRAAWPGTPPRRSPPPPRCSDASSSCYSSSPCSPSTSRPNHRSFCFFHEEVMAVAAVALSSGPRTPATHCRRERTPSGRTS
uniref:Uncharacterized protein n=1 Tax=Zea mays TaxID=4577 RepID=C4J496_MAIZE|nr:unknown [Zea mays]